MSVPPIEDNFEDVLKKAMAGLGLSFDQLVEQSALSESALAALLSGDYQGDTAATVCEHLALNHKCLAELAGGLDAPDVSLPDGIDMHTTPFPVPGYAEMTVNSYAVTLPVSPLRGIMIDAGCRFEPYTGAAAGASPGWHLFLTHTHSDHVAHFDELSGLVAKAHAPENEPYANCLPVRDGDRFEWGPFQLTATATPGHSPGGTSYVLRGYPSLIVFVGDAIFCGSVGKVRFNLKQALSRIKNRLLSLPEDSILCPGHGPPTTVGFEKSHNPFFA